MGSIYLEHLLEPSWSPSRLSRVDSDCWQSILGRGLSWGGYTCGCIGSCNSDGSIDASWDCCVSHRYTS